MPGLTYSKIRRMIILEAFIWGIDLRNGMKGLS